MDLSSITLVIGRRGYGKSRYLREQFIPAHPRAVVVFDAKGEYDLPEVYYDVDSFLDAPQFWRASCRLNDSDTSLAMAALYHYEPHTVIVEEAHRFCSPNSVDPSLDQLVRMGRLPDVSVVLVSQRAKDFPQIIFSMADELIVFQQRSVHDVRALEDQLGEDLAELNGLDRDEFRRYSL